MNEPLCMDGRLRPRRDGTSIEEAFLPSPCVQNHAANLMRLPSGDVGCVWFAGSQEGKSDISIYFSCLKQAENVWSPPIRLSDDTERSEQNPILFPTPAGDLWLLHTAQHAGNQNTSVVKRRISADGGETWGPSEVLIADSGTFVRQPLVVLANGTWLLPCFLCRTAAGIKWLGDHDISVVKISPDEGCTWRDVEVPGSTGLVHMCIVPTASAGLLALFRSRWADCIYQSRSLDNGESWSSPVETVLPNNNSSIQGTALADGRIALVFNNVRRTATTERRASLYDEIEDDDTPDMATAQSVPASPGGREAFWGTPRAPVTLAMSEDFGMSWTICADLETGDGYCLTNNSEQQLNRELSYPSVIQADDDSLHVAFTYHRRAIKYLRVPIPRP